MKNLKNIYKSLLIILSFVSLVLSFLILQPSGMVGISLTLFIGLVTYFFLWTIAQIITPNLKQQYVKSKNRNSQ